MFKKSLICLLLALPIVALFFVLRSVVWQKRTQVVVKAMAKDDQDRTAAPLIEKGIDVDAKVDEGEMSGDSLLMTAIRNTNRPLIEKLLKAGAKKDTTTSILLAAMDNREQEIEKILAAGGNPNSHDANGDTVLSYISAWNRLSMMKILLQYGANVNGKSKEGVTPLMWAASYGAGDAVQLLLAKGANPHAQDSKGKMALQRIGRYAEASPTHFARTVQLLQLASRRRATKSKRVPQQPPNKAQRPSGQNHLPPSSP